MILIGNEHADGQICSMAERTKNWLRRNTFRWFRKRAPGWNPGPSYLKAVSECPLFKHNSGILRVVMEAAGLQGIRMVNTDAIRNARLKLPNRPGSRASLRPHFFILVGTKL